MLAWSRLQHETARLAGTDAEELIKAFGDEAYEAARLRTQEARWGGRVARGRSATHWCRVRHIIGRRTGRPFDLKAAD